jgi:hypothetical protein
MNNEDDVTHVFVPRSFLKSCHVEPLALPTGSAATRAVTAETALQYARLRH